MMNKRPAFLIALVWTIVHGGVAVSATWWWAFTGALPKWLGGGTHAILTFVLLAIGGVIALVVEDSYD